MYGRYDEQRMIIERLLERNPNSNAWQQVARPGHTSFLRDHFTARCLYYIIFRLSWPRPLMMGGEQEPNLQTIEPALSALLKMEKRPRTGCPGNSVCKNRNVFCSDALNCFEKQNVFLSSSSQITCPLLSGNGGESGGNINLWRSRLVPSALKPALPAKSPTFRSGCISLRA
jgi:hypothetical protein